MPLAEGVAAPAVEGRDVNIGENVQLNVVVGLAAAAGAAAEGLADFFLTEFAHTYLGNNPSPPPPF